MDEAIERITGRQLISRGPFAGLWWATSISSLGDWVTLFATFSLAAEIAGGGRAASLGILVPLVARILPGVVIGVIGGVLADRWDRKKTMVVADFGRAVLVMVLVFVGNFRDLFLITFAIEVLSLIRQPAREAVVPQLVPPRYLMAANGLNLIGAYGTAPLGAALFALFAELGETSLRAFGSGAAISSAFAFDAITFVVSGVIMLAIPLPKVEVAREREAHGAFDVRAPLRDLKDGFRFVASFHAVRRMISGMAFGLLGGGALFVLGQPFSAQVLGGGDSGYGIIVTTLGVGVALGMGTMTVWGRKVERRQALFAISLLATGLAIVLTAFTSTVAGAAGWVFAAGAGTGVAYVTGFTHLHAVVTDDIRGRTFAALYASVRVALLLSFGLAGLGAAALDGALGGSFSNGVRLVILLSGSVIVLSGTGALWAVRAELRGEPLDEADYRTLRDAGDALTWMRGDRRSKER